MSPDFSYVEPRSNADDPPTITLSVASKPADMSFSEYISPTDLQVTRTGVSRILIIGSCLTQGWPGFISSSYPGTDADFLLFNNFGGVPDTPPQPIESYQFQILQPALRTVMPEWLYMRLGANDIPAFEAAFETARERLIMTLEEGLKYNDRHGTLSFVTNFLVPQQHSIGRTFERYSLNNMAFFVEQLNHALAEYVADRKNVYVVDMDQIASMVGKRYIQDDQIWSWSHGAVLSDADWSNDQERLHPTQSIEYYYPSKAIEFLKSNLDVIFSTYRTILGVDRVKLIVVDLDDTIWRGVIAEQANTTNVEGWPLGVAEALISLKNRGIMLAICSKNTEEVINTVFDSVWGGRLTLADFVVRKINWMSKAENIREIIDVVNIQPSSVLFIDDNPRERDEVCSAVPGVRAIGADPYLVRRILLWSAETQTSQLTQESARRTDMVRAQVQREETRRQMSRDDFLKSLGVRVSLTEVNSVDDSRFDRALELLNKTNQFNTVGRRWRHEEMAALFADGGRLIVAQAKDKFTDYGLISVAVMMDNIILQMVMSCRVIGLEVETVILAELAARSKTGLIAHTVVTEANLLSRNLFEVSGFQPDGDTWTLPAGATPPQPIAAVLIA